MSSTTGQFNQGWRGMVCLGVLVAIAVYSLATIPVAPSLIGSNPVLLELLRGSTAALISAGAFARIGEASLLLALIAPLPTLMMADPFTWWAGRMWGPSAADYLTGGSARGRKRADRAIRLVERYDSVAVLLAPFLPLPNQIIYAAAGWGGMRFRRFILLDLIGTSTWVACVVGLGYVIGHDAVDVAQTIGHYSLIVTVALIVVVFVWAFVRASRDERSRDTAPAPDPES